ncbi:unnamed protein product [Protopolystoma xenopodis]|uniref:Uncharacterized protein n=1 Tax=Protopolystoma xenopodis TaxID=117903 RepID=A0A3S5AW13_9PLAT|nr:unnamed protein product [Protopolystoma xenopodis]
MIPCSDDVGHVTDESLSPFQRNRSRLPRKQRPRESSNLFTQHLLEMDKNAPPLVGSAFTCVFPTLPQPSLRLLPTASRTGCTSANGIVCPSPSQQLVHPSNRSVTNTDALLGSRKCVNRTNAVVEPTYPATSPYASGFAALPSSSSSSFDGQLDSTGTRPVTSSFAHSIASQAPAGNNESAMPTDSPDCRYADLLLCFFCGRYHTPTEPHLYAYSQPVDADLLCRVGHPA